RDGGEARDVRAGSLPARVARPDDGDDRAVGAAAPRAQGPVVSVGVRDRRLQAARMTATLTATAAADTSGQQRTGVPVTWFYRTGVQSCPSPPTTTDQKAGPSGP